MLLRAFAKYQATPEFRAVNHAMTLDAFKRIYWWEYTHRLLGRLIGLAFLLPYLAFLVRGRIPRGYALPLAGIFVLGGLQGVVGWLMVQSGLVDAVQVIYNVFDQSPEDELLPLCQQHGVGVIVRVALDEGGLTGRIRPDTTFPEGDFRRRYFRGDRRAEVARRVAAIRADLGLAQDEIAAIALRFVLSHPAVTCVIPGMRSVRNVQRNVAVSDAGPLDRDTLTVLRRHRWVRSYYQD